MKNELCVRTVGERASKHLLALALLVGAGSLSAAPVTLVDITFDGLRAGQSPPYLRDSVPTDLPSNRLAEINFGGVEVAEVIPGMENPVILLRPVSINVNFSYSQPIAYDSKNIPNTAMRYCFAMDLFLSDFQKRTNASASVDELAILFDLPRVQRINFRLDGSTGGVSIGAGVRSYVGTFEFDQPHNLAVFLDLDRDIWSAWLDGQKLFGDIPFLSPPGGGDLLSSIRINLNDDLQLTNKPVAYIDNLRLVAFPDAPIFLSLPEAKTVECGTQHIVSALAGHGNGHALNLVWSVAGTPVATNALPASAPMNLTRVDLAVDLPLGDNRISMTATDSDGMTTTADTTVTVVDITPPTITDPTASPAILWPPNGRIVPVKVNALVEDTCSTPAWAVVGVFSNEPDFDQSDIQIVGNNEVRLRARRAANSGDRIYTLLLQAADAAGNLSAITPVQVTVPHDARRHRTNR